MRQFDGQKCSNLSIFPVEGAYVGQTDEFTVDVVQNMDFGGRISAAMGMSVGD